MARRLSLISGLKFMTSAKLCCTAAKNQLQDWAAGADSWLSKGKSMANSPFEVPNEMRDFAERSVEQARKAFEGFLSVAQRATGAAGEAAKTSEGGAKSV